MRLIFPAFIVALVILSYGGAAEAIVRRTRMMPSHPMLKIKIVENNKLPPKVSAKVYGKIPRMSARIFHGPRAKPVIRRRYQTMVKPAPSFYYKTTKYPTHRTNYVSTRLLPSNPFNMNNQRHNERQFRPHATASQEFESKIPMRENVITKPISPKSYLPKDHVETIYGKDSKGPLKAGSNFIGPNQNNFVQPVHYSYSVQSPIDGQSSPQGLQKHAPVPYKIHPSLSDEAKRYIQFMASNDYFLPKPHPDYRQSQPSRNQEDTQQKIVDREPLPYNPLIQNAVAEKLVAAPSPNHERFVFTENDAIFSTQYPRNIAEAAEGENRDDTNSEFTGYPFVDKQRTYDAHAGSSSSSLSEEIMKEQRDGFKGYPGEIIVGDKSQYDSSQKRLHFGASEFCDRKCAENDEMDDDEPLCGTDGKTYASESELLCIVSCKNADIDIGYRGPCTQDRQ